MMNMITPPPLLALQQRLVDRLLAVLPEDAIRNTLEFYNEFRLGYGADQLAKRDVKKYFSSLT
jgi:hypothetical protein